MSPEVHKHRTRGISGPPPFAAVNTRPLQSPPVTQAPPILGLPGLASAPLLPNGPPPVGRTEQLDGVLPFAGIDPLPSLLLATQAGSGGPGDVLPSPEVSSSKLQNIVRDLYKATAETGRVGTGTTADAVRSELATGQRTRGYFHSNRAEQYSNGLTNLLKSGALDYHDQLVAQSLLDDLQSALGNAP